MTEEIIYQKSSQELTALLYEALLTNIDESILFIKQTKFMDANHKLKKANDILHRLGVGLKYETGPISEQLDALYNYAATQLIEANIKKDIHILEQIKNVISTISDAWNETIQSVKQKKVTSNQSFKKISAYEQSVMTKSF